ncbi:septum-promoting GTP-binding protein 1-like [Triticum dicoccoides]|uniref:septum-promoting GTP-binding protein 1-like n=1 Tax=Triticum dicoccoides TaxID=85692 RepID=UPI001890ED5A|nr:septum-promoting GTP-binding protein 1-like [Triticum dicoccoides]
MFDLTSRCTLNNVTDWYERARKWNKTAIQILIGTKFDDFAQLPLEMQCTIVDQVLQLYNSFRAIKPLFHFCLCFGRSWVTNLQHLQCTIVIGIER